MLRLSGEALQGAYFTMHYEQGAPIIEQHLLAAIDST